MLKYFFYKRLNQYAKKRGYDSWKHLVDFWFEKGWRTDPSGAIIQKAYSYGWKHIE